MHVKFTNLPVSLVSELHCHSARSASSNQVAIPSFRTNLRRFCPSIIGSFFWNNIPQSLKTNHLKKSLERHFCASTLLNTNETLSFYNFLSYFVTFTLLFFLCINNLKLYKILRGTKLVYLDVLLSSPPIYNVIQFKWCNFCFMRFFFLIKFYLLLFTSFTLYLHNYVSARTWRNEINK